MLQHALLRARTYALARIGHTAGSLLLIDLDNFKQVNDTQGHDTGDQVLRQVAQVIERCVRAGDIACRWDGDEYVILLPRTDVKRAKTVASRMRDAAARECLHGVTMSIG